MALGVITTATYAALALQAIDAHQGLPVEAVPEPGGVHDPVEVTHYTWASANPDNPDEVAVVCDQVVEGLVPQLISEGALPDGSVCSEIPWLQ